VTTVSKLLEDAARRLGQHDRPRLEAEVLLAHVLDKPRSYLHAWPEAEVGPAQRHRFDDLVQQRVTGHPVAYLTGGREFWSLELSVSADTLIPRPETELLVELVLARLPRREALKVADLGTGSGAIAVALGRERPAWRLYAVDRWSACLRVARANAGRTGLTNLSFVQGDWSRAFGDCSLDAIVANPPYVATGDPHLGQGDVRFEPRRALAAGPDGLDALQRLIDDAPRVLKPGALIAVEHAPAQTGRLHKLLNSNLFHDIETHCDLAGLERASTALRSH
jgi:release factor glutamine methyltransferase